MRSRLPGWWAWVILAGMLALSAADSARAEGLDRFSNEAGLRFGYGTSMRKASVHLYCAFPRWGTYLVRPGKGFLGPVGISFVVEGVIGGAEAETTGFEIGFTPLFKITLPVHKRILLFVEGGAGVIWECINSPTLAHTFNFTPQAGAGVEFALRDQLGLTAAYRFRHSSNAGFYKENPAFNVSFIQIGLTYHY